MADKDAFGNGHPERRSNLFPHREPSAADMKQLYHKQKTGFHPPGLCRRHKVYLQFSILPLPGLIGHGSHSRHVLTHQSESFIISAVSDIQIHTGRHQHQCCPEQFSGYFTEKDEGEQDTDKRGNSIIGTGPCGADPALGQNIKIDAETDSKKPENHHKKAISDRADPFTDQQGQQKGCHPGPETLDHDDLPGILSGKAAGTVVFKAPADTGKKHKHRSF